MRARSLSRSPLVYTRNRDEDAIAAVVTQVYETQFVNETCVLFRQSKQFVCALTLKGENVMSSSPVVFTKFHLFDSRAPV